VDLQNLVTFEEHFYLVVVEKLPHAAHSVLHMWRVVIASESECPPTPYLPSCLWRPFSFCFCALHFHSFILFSLPFRAPNVFHNIPR
jgi:hypothetical protein